jgi:hypothetical protein
VIEQGDPDIYWGEANAANDDGHAVMQAEREAETLRIKQVAVVTRQWVQALRDTKTAVAEAQRLRGRLTDVDWEFSESSEGDAAREHLADAWQSVSDVTSIAADRLKPIEDAEKDAEIERLRAEIAELRQQRAVEFTMDSRLSSAPCLQPAAHGMCGPNPLPVRCDIPGHHAPQQASPIEGEGSDLA